MAKDFDATLSEAIDLAAGAAQTPGAVAARIRGGKRTRRKRVALSATSFVLVAAVSTAAFALSSSHGGATPQPPAATTGTPPTTPASSTPAPTTPATSTSGISGTSGRSTSASSASSSPTTTSATSPAAPTTPSPTWLTPGQVPFDNLMNWSAVAPIRCGGLVFNPNYLGSCQAKSSPVTTLTPQSLDVVVFRSNGVPSRKGTVDPTTAAQGFYTYADAADAQAGLHSITQGLLAEDAGFAGAIDPNTNRPIVSTTTVTAQTTGSIAIDHKFRDDNGAPGEVNGVYSGYSDRHFYFAVKDNIVEVLEVTGSASISSTSNDEAILATVVSALN